MSNNTMTTTPGSDDFWKDKQPIKTFNERLEIKVRKMLSEKLEPGEAYDELLISILTLIEDGK